MRLKESHSVFPVLTKCMRWGWCKYLPFFFFFFIHPAVLLPVQPANEKRWASGICGPCWVWSPLASSMLCMLHLHWDVGGHDLLLEEGQAVLWSALWRKWKTPLWRLWWGQSHFAWRYIYIRSSDAKPHLQWIYKNILIWLCQPNSNLYCFWLDFICF